MERSKRGKHTLRSLAPRQSCRNTGEGGEKDCGSLCGTIRDGGVGKVMF